MVDVPADITPPTDTARLSFAERVKPTSIRIDDIAGPMMEAAFTAARGEDMMSFLLNEAGQQDPKMRAVATKLNFDVRHAVRELAWMKLFAATTSLDVDDVCQRAHGALRDSMTSWIYASDHATGYDKATANQVEMKGIVARMEGAMDTALQGIEHRASPTRTA